LEFFPGNLCQFLVLCCRGALFGGVAVQEAAHVDVAHDVGRRPAAIEKPIHGQQDRNVGEIEADRSEDQRHGDCAGFRDSCGADRSGDRRQHDEKLLRNGQRLG
jgi:hypothetical protein